MIDEAIELVREFQKKAGQPVAKLPAMLDLKLINRRIKWIQSEFDELKAANTLEEQADAVTDCLYYLLGIYVEMGIEADSLFQIVHKANMMKLRERKTDHDGRILKPAGWRHPDEEIREAIARMK